MGHLPPESEIENRSNRHLTQSRLQVTWCIAEIYCLLHVVVQGPGSFPGRSTFLYDVHLRSYGGQICPLFGFWPIFPIHNPENVPSGDQPTAQGLRRRMITIFRCDSRRSKGVPSSSAVFLRLLVGELGIPNLPKFLPVANGYIPYRMQLHGASDLDQSVWKRAILKMDVLSYQISSPLLPKLPQFHIWGTFQCKTYYLTFFNLPRPATATATAATDATTATA